MGWAGLGVLLEKWLTILENRGLILEHRSILLELLFKCTAEIGVLCFSSRLRDAGAGFIRRMVDDIRRSGFVIRTFH